MIHDSSAHDAIAHTYAMTHPPRRTVTLSIRHLLAAFWLLLSMASVAAQPMDGSPAASCENPQPTTRRDIPPCPVGDLAAEREVLERQADRQFAAIQYVIEMALWAFGFIGTILVASLAWFLGSSRKELKRTAEEYVKQQADTLVQREAAPLRDRLLQLEGEFSTAFEYLSDSVVWVAFNPDETFTIAAALRERGLGGLSIVTPASDSGFELGDPALVVLSYDASTEADRRLQRIVSHLAQSGKSIPLLIFTYDRNGSSRRLTNDAEVVLVNYPWFVPVNYPLQLVSQITTLLRRNTPRTPDDRVN